MAEYKSECDNNCVAHLCESSAAKDLFEYDSCIKSLIVQADKLGVKKIECFKGMGEFICVAVMERLWRLIEVLDAIQPPDTVRLHMFVNESH